MKLCSLAMLGSVGGDVGGEGERRLGLFAGGLRWS